MIDRNDPDPDPVRWFVALGSCRCGKSATGTLRGPRNDSYGNSCTACADKRIKAAQKMRDNYKARNAGDAA